MALEIDTSQPFLTPSSRRKLAEAVRDAPAAESEPDWLEWKSAVDLGEKRWSAEIARHIIGFANRMPDKAERAAGGFAYLLLGAEPANLCGVTQIDNAALEAGVTAYTGHDGPQWSPEYIELEALSILVITIAPPRSGDRTYAFEKEFQHVDPVSGIRAHFRNGDIFVRHEGRTERATSSEIRMLERRFAAPVASQPTLDVALVHWDATPSPVTPLDLSDSSTDEWIESQRHALVPGHRRQLKPRRR